MKLSEIKKLNKKEFAERYPFVILRNYKGEKCYEEDGTPCLQFYVNDWGGWSDILLCWAEKVRAIFITMPKETQEAYYITDLKEKYGDMRLYTGYLKEPYTKINDYTRMVEHLSTFTCLNCGHLTKSSNGKKLLTWRTNGYWISFQCKNCAKKFLLKNIKQYGLKKGYTFKSAFNSEYEKVIDNWFTGYTTWDRDGKKTSVRLDSHELLEGMY